MKKLILLITILSTNLLFGSNIVHYTNKQFGRDIEIVITDKLINVNDYLEFNTFSSSNMYFDIFRRMNSISVIDSIYVRIGNFEINIPKELYFDIFGPRIGNMKNIAISNENDGIIFSIPCLESGGSYTVTFQVTKNQKVKRFFSYYEDLINTDLNYSKDSSTYFQK